MKINKILAAGVAATLAVTSLSAVVSAEQQTKEFDIYVTRGEGQTDVVLNADVNGAIAVNLNQTKKQKIIVNMNDAFGDAEVSELKLHVEGFQSLNAAQTVAKDFKFEKVANTTNQYSLIILDKKTPIYHDGEFASFYFSKITTLQFTATVKGKTQNETIYKSWTSGDGAKFLFNEVTIHDLKADGVTWETTATKKIGDLTGVTTQAGRRVVQQNDLQWVESQAANEITEVLTEVAALGAGPVKNGGAVTTQVGPSDSFYKKSTATRTQYIKISSLTMTQANTVVGGAAAAATAAAPIQYGVAAATYTTVAADNGIATGTVGYKVTTNVWDGGASVAGPSYFVVSSTALAPAAAGTAYTNVYAFMENAPVYEQIDMSKYSEISDATGGVGYTVTGGDKAYKYVIKTLSGSYMLGTAELGKNESKIAGKTLSDADSVAPLLAYAVAQGGYFESKNDYGNYGGKDFGVSLYKINGTTKQIYAWLPVTTVKANTDWAAAAIGVTKGSTITSWNAIRKGMQNNSSVCYGLDWSKDGTATIRRENVWQLSLTGDHASYSGVNDADHYQSYKDSDMTKGTGPEGFSGFATQVGEFFNHKDNGTITFTFTSTASSAGSAAWSSGIPSTEVGLIGSGAGSVTSNFALFFNYDSTSGMMYSPVKVDQTAGTVTFEIDQYLKDCGGLTKATLHDIYYGLNVGYSENVDYNGSYGMYVQKVTLAYDDAPAADADAAAAVDDDAVVADDDDAAAVVDADDDDDDDTDDDDLAAVITDDDEDDTAAAGTVDVVTPAAQDSNPATGVGLAVIPAIVAAAAMAISKKRK
ncbi:MAG: hypothetical protein J6N15_07990 [Ruminiclostridium sp.]|nr:hypothetical protein [Ruminiclostridium sp.]